MHDARGQAEEILSEARRVGEAQRDGCARSSRPSASAEIELRIRKQVEAETRRALGNCAQR